MFNLSIFGSHNAAIAISFGGEILEVVELERFINEKNAAFVFWGNHPNLFELVTEVANYLKQKYNVTHYDNVIYNSCSDNIERIFPANNYEWVPHHQAHAYSGLYQSPYNQNTECLIISFDGGSDEGFFNVYLGTKGKELEKIYAGKKDYAVSYMMPAHYIEDIKQEDIFTGNLVYAGKLMGLAAFGKIKEKYIQPLIDFYHSNKTDNIPAAKERFEQIFSQFGIHNDTIRLAGQEAWDLAATNQYVFELLFQKETDAILKAYPNHPIVIVGGCGLNIINNTKLASSRNIFVPPNPNDCGLAVGLLASKIKPFAPVDCTYIGPEVWDNLDLGRHLFERKGTFLNLDKLAVDIISGKIFGVVRGRCEQGPRALGNRSIICNPTIAGMKDTLNARVKGREYYRPFAPVVRLEDVNKYFYATTESRWMSFCPKVRPEYRDILSAITHADGTARVQTVTREQNEFLYDLLTKINDITGYGVLLNTSFNVAGKPILNTYREAFQVLDTKDMDGLILDNYCFMKNR